MINVLVGDQQAGERHEYTSEDVLELSMLASCINGLAKVANVYLQYCDDDEAKDGLFPVLNAIELMSKPVEFFLHEGCELADTEKEEAA
jgi:hypothetical protein